MDFKLVLHRSIETTAVIGKVGTRATCLFFDLSESMPIVVSGTDGAWLALSVMEP
jgi:hypothetical protein